MIVWLASYPRSGNTFLRIVLHATFGVDTHTVYDDDDPVAQRVGPALVGYAPRPAPLDEMAASDQTHFVKTHRLRPDDSPALVVVRHGLDAITSYAHLRASASADPTNEGAYRQAFEREAETQITRTDDTTGSWGRNVLSWVDGTHPHREVLRYEDLVARPASAVEAARRLAPGLTADPDAVLPTFAELHAGDPGFFRRGTGGSHRDELPERLVDRFWSIPEHRHAMRALDTVGSSRTTGARRAHGSPSRQTQGRRRGAGREDGGMASFGSGERAWTERLGNLRNVIRQELIGRQLAEHVEPGASVLDVGCGQGTQGLRLAQRGCTVTGVDPSPDLLARFSGGAAAADVRVELLEGTVDDLDALLGDRRFDVVCAHGVLMYLDDRAGAIAALARRVAHPGGRLSITVRNGHALAMRPGLRGDWAGAVAAFDTTGYTNEIGVRARADRLEDVTADLEGAGMGVVGWAGVRVFNDAISPETPPPSGPELEVLLDAEDLAGRLDPYRWMASQLHVIAAPTPAGAG